MADVFDYLRWRGDLSFENDPVNPVDALIFAALSYLQLPKEMEGGAERSYTIQEMAAGFFDQEDIDSRCISRNDYRLLEQAAATERFGACMLTFYRDILNEEEDTQFAAESWLLPGGTVVLAFRGTDNTITGWKEDFNMSYRSVVPSQKMAMEYAREVLHSFAGKAVFTGHSKGGNLAKFAAANIGVKLRKRIAAVYNMDGPGFPEGQLKRSGYQAMLPVMHSYVPQSSVIGMLMEHREDTTIVHSTQLGIMQHDLYSWQLLGRDFERRQELTHDAVFFNDTIRAWADSMDETQRSRVVEVVFGLIKAGGVKNTSELLKPATVYKYLKMLSSDDDTRRAVAEDLQNLLHYAAHHENNG